MPTERLVAGLYMGCSSQQGRHSRLDKVSPAATASAAHGNTLIDCGTWEGTCDLHVLRTAMRHNVPVAAACLHGAQERQPLVANGRVLVSRPAASSPCMLHGVFHASPLTVHACGISGCHVRSQMLQDHPGRPGDALIRMEHGRRAVSWQRCSRRGELFNRRAGGRSAPRGGSATGLLCQRCVGRATRQGHGSRP